MISSVGQLAPGRVRRDSGRAQSGGIDHFVHLAAVYDMTADEATNEVTNVGGTPQGTDARLANAWRPGASHHVSSVAVAGEYEGRSLRPCSTRPGTRPPPYHATKFGSRSSSAPAGHSVAGVSPRDRRRPFARPARWTRSTAVYFFPASSIGRAYLPAGCRSSGPTSVTRTSFRSTSSPPQWTTSPTRTGSTARLST